MGIASHMPITPTCGRGAVIYARSTLVPKDMTVSTSDISGFSMPR